MSSKILSVLGVILAVKGMYLSGIAKTIDQRKYARYVSLAGLVLALTALMLRS